MRVLLDECAPRVIKRRLRQLNILTVQEVGWRGYKNGQLLRAVGGQFDVLVTTDKNIRHQQDVSKLAFGVIVLPTNRLAVILKIMDDIAKAIERVRPGEIIEIPLPA